MRDTEPKTYVVGDLHGCGKELQALLRKVSFRNGIDKLILVGDCFDRARDGHIVWRVIKETGAQCLLGNHEAKFIQYLSGRREHLPPHYYWTLNNLVANGIKLDDFYNFLVNLPLLIEPTPAVIVAHAGVNVIDPRIQNESANVYGNLIAEKPMPRPTKGDKQVYWWDLYRLELPLIIYGHLVVENNKARINHSINGQVNSIGIDSAVCHGGPVTCYCLEDKIITQYQSGIDYFSGLKAEFKESPPVPIADVLFWIEGFGKQS